jgi:type III pantothenate kinase
MKTFFVIDVGNTETKWALADERSLRQIYPVLTQDFIKGKTWKFPKIDPRCKPQGAIISSVVPEALSAIRKSLLRYKIRVPLLVSSKLDLGIRIRYPRPAAIGADRLVNAAAAVAFYGCPAVVIDFGTAVTFDVISSKGEYLGGVIAPGLAAMTHYLHERTALLPQINLKEPKASIGTNTVMAMRIGAVVGYRGLVREILKGVWSEMRLGNWDSTRRTQKGGFVIATGGHASLIAKGLPEIRSIDKHLTLRGLRMLWLRNRFSSTGMKKEGT